MQLDPIHAKDREISTGKWIDQNIYAYLGMSTFTGIEPFCKTGAMTLLNEQTRMRKGICEIVSGLFYNGLLTGDRADTPISFDGSGLSRGDVSVLDPGMGGEMFGLDRLPASFAMPGTNTISAGRTISAIRSLARSNPEGRKLDILIITPFRNQAYKVYKSRLTGLTGGKKEVQVRVSTVHGCQGAEADVVFFDLVNPISNFVARADSAHLWCVACSRAKEKLVIVGETNQLRHGYYSSEILKKIEVKDKWTAGKAA
jgi:superfamily I DNA and/or RNA helicase